MVEKHPEAFPENLTWDEFLALPYELRNASLVDGEVIVNPPSFQHELVVGNLLVAFRQWTRAGTRRGQASTQQPVKVNDRQGYQPDVLWFPDGHCAVDDEGTMYVTGPPSVVIEVLSPSTRLFDLARKRRDYERIGIGEAWFIEPRVKRGVVICQRPNGDDKPFVDVVLAAGDHITSPLLDGFDLPIDELFRR